MTQEATPVGGEATPVEPTTPEAFGEELAKDVFGIEDEEEPAEGAEAEEQSAEGAEDEPEAEEEADDLPPIDAPVSLTAEEKEAFKNLPREAQEFTARRIGELEKGFNAKAQEAARARQDAERAALTQLAQVQATYAQEYQQLAVSLQAQKPDAMLQVTDPVAYAQQMQAFDRSEAQRSNAQQQAQALAHNARALVLQAEQANHAEQHRVIVDKFPEYADPTTGPELQRKLTAVAKELGYTDELIEQARASDILAMRTAADWKAKADKYDAIQKSRMANVRAAKGKPPVTARPGVAQGSEQLRARTAQSALDTALSSKNRDVQGAAFYQFLEASGQIK